MDVESSLNGAFQRHAHNVFQFSNKFKQWFTFMSNKEFDPKKDLAEIDADFEKMERKVASKKLNESFSMLPRWLRFTLIGGAIGSIWPVVGTIIGAGIGLFIHFKTNDE